MSQMNTLELKHIISENKKGFQKKVSVTIEISKLRYRF